VIPVGASVDVMEIEGATAIVSPRASAVSTHCWTTVKEEIWI
jgi:hypothetical protein